MDAINHDARPAAHDPQPVLAAPRQAAAAMSTVPSLSSPPSPPSRHRDPDREQHQPPPHRAGRRDLPKMLFSDLYKSPKSPLSKLRHHAHPPQSLHPDLDADLVSRDKTRQKDAVRRHLADKVRDDWHFAWPPVLPPTAPRPGPAADDAVPPPAADDAVPPPAADGDGDADGDADGGSEAESVYSTVSEDAAHYRPRAEWTSDLSDDDDDDDGGGGGGHRGAGRDETAAAPPSPFRFDSPDAVGASVKASAGARKRRRRHDARAEMRWNDGLACFSARRDAWTGAQTVRVKPKTPSPASPTLPRRSLWRFSSHSRSEPPSTPPAPAPAPGPSPSPFSPGTSNPRHSGHSVPETTTPPTSDRESHESSLRSSDPHPRPGPRTRHREYAVETLLPLPAPLLPPANPMRASITPAIYTSLYDKVVVHSLQPSCPVNLSDMIRSCVAGWKRDGEWPPRPIELPPGANVVVVRRKKKDAAAAAARDPAKGDAPPTSPTAATVPAGRRMSIGAFLNRASVSPERELDDAAAGKGIRRSIQRVFGLGHSHGHGHGRSASLGSVPNEPPKEEPAAAA